MNIETLLTTLDAGRDPERASLRRAAMRESAHAFFRGTAPLFYTRLAQHASEIPASPLMWCSGDLHLENVGAYRGDNRLTYFDITDFDEGALAPVAWELVRLATSIRIAARTSSLAPRIDDSLVHAALAEYGAQSTDGTLRWIERATAKGVIREFMNRVKKRSRRKFVDERTTMRRGEVALRLNSARALEPSLADRETLEEWFSAWREADAGRREWELVDVARRVTGLASLGNPRWVVLVRTPKLRLFDVKGAISSSLAAASATLQPGWPDEASRIVALARRLPVVAPARLSTTRVGEIDAVAREMQPGNDRIAIASLTDLRSWQRVCTAVAALAAWSHLRGAGRQGADRPDALSWWGREVAALEQVSRLSRRMADEHLELWHQFREIE